MTSTTSMLLVLFILSVGVTVINAARLPWCTPNFTPGSPFPTQPCSWDTTNYNNHCECPSPWSACAVKIKGNPAWCYNPIGLNASAFYKVIKVFNPETVNDCCDRAIDATMNVVVSNGAPWVVGNNKFPNNTILQFTCKPGYYMVSPKQGQLCSSNCQTYTPPQAITKCVASGNFTIGVDTWWNDTNNAVFCNAFRNLNEPCGEAIIDYYHYYYDYDTMGVMKSKCQPNLTCTNGLCTLPIG